MDYIQKELGKIWSMEEIKIKQRARDKDIKEGDRNTAYFQAVANQRKRKKKTILAIDSPEGMVTEMTDMLKVAAEFYENVFGFENKLDFHLGDNFWEDHEKVLDLENDLLEAPFSEDEIKEAIFESYAGGAPSSDGFSFLFYQHF